VSWIHDGWRRHKGTRPWSPQVPCPMEVKHMGLWREAVGDTYTWILTSKDWTRAVARFYCVLSQSKPTAS